MYEQNTVGLPCLALSVKVVRLRYLLNRAWFWVLFAQIAHAGRLLEGNPATYRQLLV